MTAPTPIHLPNLRLLAGWIRGLGVGDADGMYLAHAIFHRVEALCEGGGTGIDLPDVTSALRFALAPAPVARQAALAFLDGQTPWPMPPDLGDPLAPAGVWRFDPSGLDVCLGRDEAWKAAHGFPADVREIVRPAAGDPDSVLLDCPRQARLLLVVSSGEIRGYAFPRDESPELPREAFRCPVGGSWLASLTGDLPADAWRQAWLTWSKPRGVPVPEAEECSVEANGSVLTVRTPGRTAERLRGSRSDAWILAGTGRARPAARLEILGS